MYKVPLKPLSVNDAWKGRRFSTPAKKAYEIELRKQLAGTTLTAEAPYEIHFVFHISSMQDYDNCIKVTQDTICQFYGINDRDFHKAIIEKRIAKRGEEYFEFDIL